MALETEHCRHDLNVYCSRENAFSPRISSNARSEIYRYVLLKIGCLESWPIPRVVAHNICTVPAQVRLICFYGCVCAAPQSQNILKLINCSDKITCGVESMDNALCFDGTLTPPGRNFASRTTHSVQKCNIRAFCWTGMGNRHRHAWRRQAERCTVKEC